MVNQLNFNFFDPEQGLLRILSNKIMKAQRPKVAKFGVSIFFTTLSPDLSDKTIIKNNYIYEYRDYTNDPKIYGVLTNTKQFFFLGEE